MPERIKYLPRPTPRRRPGIAYVTDHGRYSTLTMRGFDEDDLAAVKRAASMTWDASERCWVLHSGDVDEVITVLEEELNFFVRVIER